MPDIIPIKVSELDPIRVQDINRDDEFMVNEGETFKISLGASIDFLLESDLDFTGNVTFKNTIQPPPGEELNGVFDTLTIRKELKLRSTVEIEGLYVNKHFEDVNATPQDGDMLIWDKDNNEWVDGKLSNDAPKDDKCYVKKGQEWVLLEEC